MEGWAEARTHNPDEITLLCDRHHKKRTNGLPKGTSKFSRSYFSEKAVVGTVFFIALFLAACSSQDSPPTPDIQATVEAAVAAALPTTPTETLTPTPDIEATVAAHRESTLTAFPTPTSHPSPTLMPTETPTPSPTLIPTSTPVPTLTPTPSPTPSPTPDRPR